MLARLGILAQRDFAIYWSGGLLSNVGTWLQTVSAAVLMLTLTGSPLMVGLLGTAGFLPIVLFTVFAGAASDRFDRRRIVIVTHLLAMVTTAGLAALALGGRIEPWMLLGAAFLTNASYAFAKPAIASLLPSLVPRDRLVEAASVNVLQFTAGQTIGSLLAALVLIVSTPGVAFAVNAVTFLGPIVAMLLIHPVPQARSTAPGAGAIAGGFRFIRTVPTLLAALVAVSMASAAVEATRTLSPVLVTTVLGAEEGATGLMIAAASLGSVAGILAIPRLLTLAPISRIASTGFVVQCAGLLLQGFAPSLPAALGGACVVGVGFSLSFTQMTALLQLDSPDELRGRVMAIHTLAHLGIRPFASLLVGALAAAAGGRIAIVLFGLLAPIGLAAVLRATRGDRVLATVEAASD